MVGRSCPGCAQTVVPPPTSKQLQPAFLSVSSVTPVRSAVSTEGPVLNAVIPEGTAPADGIALGVDGDAQAANPPRTTNHAQTRLNTFDMWDLLLDRHFRFDDRGSVASDPGFPLSSPTT